MLVGALVVAGVAFALPWLPPSNVQAPTLEKYAPLEDGDAFFLFGQDGNGKPLNWTSRTIEILPTSRALAGELSTSTREAIHKFMRREGEPEIDIDTLAARLDGAVMYRQTDRTLNVNGQLSEIVSIVVRDGRGETVISSFFPQDDFEVVFDPPLLTLPASFEVGRAWENKEMAGSLPYVWKTRVAGRDPAKDCWTVETAIQLVSETRTEIDYCGGRGIVATRSFDAAGVSTEQTQVFFRDAPLPSGILDAFPVDPQAATEILDANYENWTLARLGRVGQNISAGEATIPPLWLPTKPSRVLASGYLGAFFAYDANDPGATALWSFPVEGTVYSPPAYDAATGRIYFGASDKRLYALDARGMFLWSFLARDNIAARPLLANGLVIFGSEDRYVYALKAENGELVWSAPVASPIVSAAAIGNGNVTVGSDDGTVYALDAKTGQTRWTYGADDAVQTPIVIEDGTAYVTSRGGTLYALGVSNGAERWSADAGAELKYAALVANGHLYVVAGDGTLVAFDALSGAEAWRTRNTGFSGTPLVVNDALIVAGSDGNVYRLDREGHVLQTWASANVSNTLNRFKQAPALGGDAVWLVDDLAGLWRLGTPRATIAALNPVWAASIAEAPFQQFALTTSPTAFGARAVVLDEGSNVYVMDPQSGKAQRVGQILPEGSQTTRLDSVVSKDTLFTIIGKTLYATNLRDGTLSWKAEGTLPSYRPVTVAGDVVLWTQLNFDQTGSSVVQGTVTALDRASGEVRWQNEMQGSGYPSGVTVRDGVVYTAEPAAYDLATGEQKWRTTFDDWTVGEPALSPNGQVLYVPASETETGMVLALDTRDGKLLWQKPTSTNTPSFVEKVYTSGDSVIVSGLNGTVASLTAADGAPRWTFEPPAARLGTLDVQDGRVWMMLQDGRVVAVDVETGKLAAQFSDLDLSLTSGVTQHPLVIDGTVIVPYGTLLLGLREAP